MTAPRPTRVLSAALAAASLVCSSPAPPPPVTAERPNIVVVLADDLDVATMAHLPRLKAMFADQGTTFANAFVDVPQCCPSRASILRGQYAHNTKVFTNDKPDGGSFRFRDLGLDLSTVATWLQAAGYRTALVGKYLNGYLSGEEREYVPPGWDDWFAIEDHAYLSYAVNDNGTLRVVGRADEDYSTDALAREASDIVRRNAADPSRRPLFLYVAPTAPHSPATPARRHAAAFSDLEAPRTPAFDEADVTDKPPWLRERGPLEKGQVKTLDEAYRERLRTMLGVEDLASTLLDALRETGELDRTYLFFSSDNGFHIGQHRLRAGKLHPYEEDIRVPLLVRGPGVPAGAVREHLVLNTDLAPTWAELAGATAPGFVDGRSILPLLRDPPQATWRAAILVEIIRPRVGAQLDSDDEEETQMPPYTAIRTQRYTYVEYATGERELYDLQADPYQLENIAASADAALVKALADRLAALRSCSGSACRSAEDR